MSNEPNAATQAVLEFLKDVDMESWREHTPITGDFATDKEALTADLISYTRWGARLERGAVKTDAGACAEMACDLAAAALVELVDWHRVLGLWYGTELIPVYNRHPYGEEETE